MQLPVEARDLRLRSAPHTDLLSRLPASPPSRYPALSLSAALAGQSERVRGATLAPEQRESEMERGTDTRQAPKMLFTVSGRLTNSVLYL